MRKHHADEQFLARRNVRDLPQTIASLKSRLQATEADRATAQAHANDPVLIHGSRIPADKIVSALGAVLDSLPSEVRETRRFAIGTMRGLSFGLIKYRFSAPEVYLEGAGVRQTHLSRDSQGPRAVLNALERLFSGFDSRCQELRRELALSEVKLRDFEARLGASFPHEHYIEELSALRDELRVALSVTEPQAGAEPQTRTTAELSELINGLKERHTVDVVPVKRAEVSTVEPVTSRIRRKREALPAQVPAAEPEQPVEAVVTPRQPTPMPPPRPAARSHPEGRRRKYQKWLF